MARRDPRLVLLPVAGSTSKAQNINAAVTRVRGDMVGIFDADHHPAPDAFRHAWHWLSHGYDVVQGHCVIRNGDSSWVAKLVGVEFEAIYAVSHPGRTRLYTLRRLRRLQRFLAHRSARPHPDARLDAHRGHRRHMRALHEGAKIATDRTLVSRELAPTTVKALWNQRSRWAQGWLQVSLKYLWRALRSPAFTFRQKPGLFVLLGWREVQPWLTLQILPVLLYAAWRRAAPANSTGRCRSCLLATLVTLSAGVVQALFAWRLAVPELRRRRAWFWRYLFVSTFFYSHFKNIVARQALSRRCCGTSSGGSPRGPAAARRWPAMSTLSTVNNPPPPRRAHRRETGAAMPARRRNGEIQGYRGLAAMATVVFHVWQQYFTYEPGRLPSAGGQPLRERASSRSRSSTSSSSCPRIC